MCPEMEQKLNLWCELLQEHYLFHTLYVKQIVWKVVVPNTIVGWFLQE